MGWKVSRHQGFPLGIYNSRFAANETLFTARFAENVAVAVKTCHNRRKNAENAEMTYIHQRPGWPHLKWDDARLMPVLADTRHRQGRLLGQMEGLGFTLRSEASLTTLTSDVVGSSAIEGEKLNAEEVRSSIARRLGIEYAGAAVASRNVEGVVEMMLDGTRRFAEPLTVERLFGWHSSLFPTGRSGMHRITVGAWRPAEAGAMQVVSGPVGHEKVHFEAPEAGRLDAEMARFLEWFEGATDIDPVLKAGIAHFWFVTIHPFEDGNGRIARAIADMALARADRTADRFYSMSAQIETERKDYYDILERGQRGGLDITPWLEWFLDCLGRAIDKAQESLAGTLRKARLWEWIHRLPVNERQRKVINRLLDGFEGKLSSSKYAKLAKCSADTALRDIKELLERGILIQDEAGGRSTSYHLAEIDEDAGK
ncbi:MAG TPA: Fic family protein [Chthoniobacteraceae bacterium]|nr:Fic family protein [Chthoniobacteraceae bacterium]